MLHPSEYKIINIDLEESNLKFKNCTRIRAEYQGQQLAIIQTQNFEDLVYLKKELNNVKDWGYLTTRIKK